MSRFILRRPEVVASGLLLIVIAAQYRRILVMNDGTFTYCLDDAYIHMAMAKNLALHHVWGNTQYGFASASSSPLWVLLLAAADLFRVSDLTPLILNVIFAVAALFVAAAILRRRDLPRLLPPVAVLALAFLVPFPPVIFDGMEHMLHILLVVVWIGLLDEALRSNGALSRRQLAGLCAVAFLLDATRFESLALVGASGAVLFLRQRRVEAALIGFSGAAALAVYAAFSIAHGWHALPNSVLIKSPWWNWHTVRGIAQLLGGRALSQVRTAPHLAVLLAAAVAALWAMPGRPSRALLFVFVATALAHLQLAQLGWFYRYEAYLMALGLLALGLSMELGQAFVLRRPVWALLLIPFVYPLVTRTREALRSTPEQAKNIYDQHWQMGRFLAEQAGDASVAMNDIGAASYLSKARILDLTGLADMEAARVFLSGGYTRASFDALIRSRQVALAVIYEDMFHPVIPRQWQLLGRWQMPPPLGTLGGGTVSFYATEAAHAADLRQKLLSFSQSQLPADVGWTVALE